MKGLQFLFGILIVGVLGSCKKEEITPEEDYKITENGAEFVFNCDGGEATSWFDSLYTAAEITDGFVLESLHPDVFGNLIIQRSALGKLDSLVFGTNNSNDTLVQGYFHYCLGSQFFVAEYHMNDRDSIEQYRIDTVDIWHSREVEFYDDDGELIEVKQQLMVSWINWDRPYYDNHYGYYLKED